ncbi:uncharacterized protein [Heterodontus francisci]|uniref:uncharacterized protein n=1 Tax=Heterodontus francisci TaxID=7792 RepID=UPI00355C01AF
MKPTEGETVVQFVMRLHQTSKGCNYGNDLGNQLRDQVVQSCQSNYLWCKLLEKDVLTLTETLRVAALFEAVEAQIQLMKLNADASASGCSGSNSIQVNNLRFSRGQDFQHLQYFAFILYISGLFGDQQQTESEMQLHGPIVEEQPQNTILPSAATSEEDAFEALKSQQSSTPSTSTDTLTLVGPHASSEQMAQGDQDITCEQEELTETEAAVGSPPQRMENSSSHVQLGEDAELRGSHTRQDFLEQLQEMCAQISQFTEAVQNLGKRMEESIHEICSAMFRAYDCMSSSVERVANIVEIGMWHHAEVDAETAHCHAQNSWTGQLH